MKPRSRDLADNQPFLPSDSALRKPVDLSSL